MLSNSKTTLLMTHRTKQLLKQRKSKIENSKQETLLENRSFQNLFDFPAKFPFFLSGVVRGHSLRVLRYTSSVFFPSQKAISLQADLFPSLTEYF